MPERPVHAASSPACPERAIPCGLRGRLACGARTSRRPNRRQHECDRRISERLPKHGPCAANLGQPRTERLDRGTAKACGSAQTVKADEDAHPMDISHADPYADMQIANSLAQGVEHVHRLQEWHRGSAAFAAFLVDGIALRKPESA